MLGLPVQERVGEVEHALYGEQRAKEEAAKRAAAEERAAKRAAERQKVQKAKEWSDEEVRLLEKALDKFPQVPYFTPCNSIYMSGLLPFWNCEIAAHSIPQSRAWYPCSCCAGPRGFDICFGDRK